MTLSPHRAISMLCVVRLLSVSSPNAAAWLSVLPSPGLNLHMDPAEFQVALKWWLGMDLAQGLNCTFCMSKSCLGSFGLLHVLASMGVMWLPATIHSVMFLWSVVGALMYLPKSRLEWLWARQTQQQTGRCSGPQLVSWEASCI